MTRRRERVSVESSEEDDDSVNQIDPVDNDDLDDHAIVDSPKLVTNFIRMWPRAVFSTKADPVGKKTIAATIKELERPGVYILYRDDIPFYVGKTDGKLRFRLRQHAINVGSVKNYFWNYFSAFIVEDAEARKEVEAILISAMPSVITNSSTPQFKERVPMNEQTRLLMRQLRERGQY